MSLRIIKNGTEYIIADASDNTGGGSVNVVDSLNSTSTTDALSANQGRVLNNSITTTNGKIGTLATLTTQDKTNLVNAINEIVTQLGQVPSDVYTKTEVDNLIDGVEAGVASDLANYYNKTQIDSQLADLENEISAIPKFAILVVNQLPTTNISTTTVYLVPADDPETGNIFEEYIYVNNAWELLGSQKINLTNYYTKSEVNSLVAHKIISSDDTVLDIISLTQSEYDTLKQGGNLVNGTIYNITDGNGDHTEVNVIDNLNSTSGQDALSAKQGKILNDKLTGLINGVCPLYNENNSYIYGDFCFNITNNTVYRCISTTTVTGSFDSSKWQAVDLSQVVNGLTNKFYSAYTLVSSGTTYFSIDYKGFLYNEIPEDGTIIHVKFPTTNELGDAYLSLIGSATFKYPIVLSDGTSCSITNVADSYLTLVFDATSEQFYIYVGVGLVNNIQTI